MKIESPPVVNNIEDYVSIAIEIANTNSYKLLELKKYYSESAEKNLYKNEKALKSFQDTLIKITQN